MGRLLFRPWPALLVMLVSLSWVGSAAAHAQLLAATPAQNAVMAEAPEMAQLTFNEEVTPLAVTLVAPDGTQADLTQSSTSGTTVSIGLPHGLGNGTHVVSWRVASIDGHPVAGSLIFSIGAATDAPQLAASDNAVSVTLWAAKALLYVALFFGVGGAVFGLVAPLPRGVDAMVRAISIAGLVLAPLSLGLHGTDALGLHLLDLLQVRPWMTGASTSYGLTVATLFVSFVFALLALALTPRLAVVSWVVAAVALALSGHASAADPQWLTRPAVFLHVGGVLFWQGRC